MYKQPNPHLNFRRTLFIFQPLQENIFFPSMISVLIFGRVIKVTKRHGRSIGILAGDAGMTMWTERVARE